MKYQIDISSILRKTVCDLYSNLVTRSTGAAVRKAIEDALSTLPEPEVTVIDFSAVTTLDFSCADEVVGKLLNGHQSVPEHRKTYFFFRGLHEAHLEAIEAVLERYGLAAIVQDSFGRAQLVGTLDDAPRRAWHYVSEHGAVIPGQVEEDLGVPCESLFNELWTRRLLMRRDDGYFLLPYFS